MHSRNQFQVGLPVCHTREWLGWYRTGCTYLSYPLGWYKVDYSRKYTKHHWSSQAETKNGVVPYSVLQNITVW